MWGKVNKGEIMKMKIWIPVVTAFVIFVFVIIGIFIYNYILVQEKEADHNVIGVDVSVYQGEIDWTILSSQNIDFAYIKATEGADHVDSSFVYNWEESQKTGLKVGAYHFFNFDVSGAEQAQNFIDTVEMTDQNLPPVIDLEIYGEYISAPKSIEETRAILDELISELENYYNVKPIIYTNLWSFRTYLGSEYQGYKIWIVDLDSSEPDVLPNGEEYTFWQYSHRGVLDGYQGEELFIDMNIYNGTYEEFINEFYE
jgi:lysozyme